MPTIDPITLSELSHHALRLPINVRLAATQIVPLDATAIRERAPGVVTKPETVNVRTMVPAAGGLFDPVLFGVDRYAPDEHPLDEDPDALVDGSAGRFARVSLPVPLLHPLFDEHLQREIAKRIGWERFDVGSAMLPPIANRLAEALDGAGLGMLVMRELPILPIRLRRLVVEHDGKLTSNDTVDLYRRVINRSSRLARLIELGSPDVMLQNEAVMMRDAIHHLFENDEIPEDREPVRGPDGEKRQSLRSLCVPYGDEPAPGTVKLWRSLQALESYEPTRHRGTHDASIQMPYRFYVARAVMFAMGFDLRPLAS